MVKVVIFDVGGTLIKSPLVTPRIFDISNQLGLFPADAVTHDGIWQLFTQLGYDLNLMATPQEELDSYKHVVQELIRRYNPSLADTLTPQQLAGLENTAAEYVLAWTDSAQLHTESLSILQRLQADDIPLGVISNWPSRLRDVLQRLQLTDYFQHIVISSEVACAKPDPHIFHMAADAFGVAPGECLYVGDNLEADVKGATAARMPVYWVRRYPQQQNHAYAGPQGETLHGLLPLALASAG